MEEKINWQARPIYIDDKKVGEVYSCVDAREICSFLSALGFRKVYYKTWFSLGQGDLMAEIIKRRIAELIAKLETATVEKQDKIMDEIRSLRIAYAHIKK